MILISIVSFLLGQDEAEIVFAGDAMQHYAQIQASRTSDGTHSYDACFAKIAGYVSDADYAVVNLETPLGGKPYRGYPCFSAPDSYSQALANAGFDMMLTANNHSLDRLDAGVRRTLDVLDKQGIAHVGTYRNKAERDTILPIIKDINGFKVAFLNYTYGTNGITVKGKVVVDYINRGLMASDIARARDAGAEIITVTVHWGNEYQLLPHVTQKSLANFLVDQGVDLIIGGHPHVIQPMEVRHSEKYDKDVLLVYSLGNFISNMTKRDTRGGAMVKAKLTRDKDGRARFDSATYRLIFTMPPCSGNKNFIIYPAEDCPNNQWKSRCDDFVRSAKAIFDKHNVNVPIDTNSIKQYVGIGRVIAE